MKYRKNKKTGDSISEIGIGSTYMFQAGEKEAIKALRRAVEGGINYFDMAAGDDTTFSTYGEAFRDLRKDIFFQLHFGTEYEKGTYGWTLDGETIKKSVDWQLKELHTDYIDYGFIHCQDEVSDWETYKQNGVYDYILDLKKQGVIHHLGLSSHTPSTIVKILDEVDVDMLMFSVNPAYDYGHGDYAHGRVDERTQVFERCEKDGIGISVMKPFSGGQLLSADTSPFGKALTTYQCIRYSLDRPAVLTVLPGAQSVKEVDNLLAYYDATDDETDYSIIGSFTPTDAVGRCVYCNHCKPCPVGIDVGLVNKYYDLALAGDDMAVQHYKALEKNASDCIQCGHCDSRCPFQVKQSERMTEIRNYMSARL